MQTGKSKKDEAKEYKELSLSWESTTEALLVLVVAAALGVFGGAVHCAEYHSCHEAGTCANASRYRSMELSCSFTNYVSVSGDVLYGSFVSNYSNYLTLTRGVCAPGERLHINSVSGQTECAPWRSWPNALNAEIMQPGATAVHDQMCGAWIQAGPSVPLSTTYWSFYDLSKSNAAVMHADAAAYSSTHLASTDLGKFYSACQQAVLGGSGAIRASGKGAYSHLKTGLAAVTTPQRVMEGAGWLASHHCDGPVLMGVTVDGATYKATAFTGSHFSAGTLAEALYAVDEGVSLQNLAESGNAFVNANAATSPAVTMQEIDWLIEGATGRTDHANVPLLYASTPELDGLKWLTDNGYLAEASAFLHGQAAMCAFALQGALQVTSAGEWGAKEQDLHRLQLERPAAAALGRLAALSTPAHMTDPDNKTLARASTITWSQLKAAPQGNAATDCPVMANFLFPDRLEHEHFNTLVTPKLHERLEHLVNNLSAAVQHVVQNDPNIANVLQDPAAVAAAVQSTRIRLAGAPRGSWGGIERDYADGVLSSTDGPMLMALKQSRAIFMDRINILFDNLNVCTGPPVYDSLDANAYVYPGGECSHVLLGVLRPPFADERYDDVSLASRVGYIIGHELAHNTMVTPWAQGPLDALLSQYTSNYYSEALADLVGSLAVIHAGYATAQDLCYHVSQLWCARVPLTWQSSTTASHPGANERGDKLCQTFVDLGLT